FDATAATLASVADLEHVQEQIFFRRRRWRNLNAPRAGHHVLAIRRQDTIEVIAPKEFPHLAKLWIFRKRSALRWLERPVLARTPGASAVVTGRVELVTASAAPRDDAFLREQAVREQLALAFGEAESFRLPKLLRAGRRIPGFLIDARLIHSMQQPRLEKRR